MMNGEKNWLGRLGLRLAAAGIAAAAGLASPGCATINIDTSDFKLSDVLGRTRQAQPAPAAVEAPAHGTPAGERVAAVR